jgi:hypothetical protein
MLAYRCDFYCLLRISLSAPQAAAARVQLAWLNTVGWELPTHTLS